MTEEHSKKAITNPKGLDTAAMEALNAIGDHLRSKLDSVKLAQTSLAEINRILRADLAVVYLRGVDDVLRPLAIQSNSEIFSEITLSHHRLGRCLCGLAAAGEIICSDNVHHDSRCTNNECKEAGILSFAALPLRYGEDIIGVLSLAFVEEQNLTAARVLMATMADLLAMGLHNTILFEKIERYAAEQEEHISMLAMNAEINGILTTSAADLPAALNLCCDSLVKTMRAAFARVWMLDSTGENLELKASAGMYTHLDGSHSHKKKTGDDKISQIFQTQHFYVNNDISGSPLIIDQEWGRRERMKAFAGIPLFVGDNAAGVLGIFSKNTFSELNIKGLRTAADSISLWIEQKTMEQRLWKQTRLFEAIFNAVPDAFIFADAERRIKLCNQGFVNMFGYSDSEVIGLKTKILYADEDDFERQGRIRFNQEVKKLLNPYEINFKRRDGTVFPTETIGTVVRTKDEKGIIGYLALIRDVTRRKEAEKHQRHMQKMEALGTLSSGIAHDFNNLLNVISGFTDLTLLDLREDSLQYRNLREVKNASKRAADLVKQILSFSRGLEEELRLMAIQPLMKEVVKLLSSTLPATIQVKQHLEPCGMVLADSSQIHQVLMNLCTNAFHAMRQTGGVLDIGLRQEEISSGSFNGLPAGNYALLTVSDTGCGMSAGVKERIFEPYFTTKEQEEGTGLGLATVHGIIKAHGGMITVESETNKGSTFRVYLPVIDQRAEVKNNEMDSVLSLPEINARVLLVDDVRFNIDLGGQLLERTGCTVRGMTDSMAALALFRKAPNSFDLVITDQTMPVMTGFEMARKMLKIRPDLPIIMVSGHSELVDEQAALRLGIRAFIHKPLSLDTLFEAVTKALKAKGRHSGMETKGEIMTKKNLGVDIEAAARAHLKKKYRLPDDKITPMLAEVRRELPKFIAQALDDSNHHNWPRLAESAHAIKGQLLTLGFDELGEMARVIELGAKTGEDIDYSAQLRRLNSRLGNWKAEGIE